MRIYFLVFIFSISGITLIARPFRVDQVPNGSKNQCMTCHTSMGGGNLNVFGQEVLSNHLTSKNSSGNVVWSSALASLDSDKDGFTNGQELLDPSGTWKIGDANPGKSSDVGSPGNPNIVPVSVGDWFARNNFGSLTIQNISPNPVKESFNLLFRVNDDSYVKIELFDLFGNSIAEIQNKFMIAGEYNININPEQSSKMSLVAGNYWLLISSENSFDIKSIKIVK